MGFLCVPRRFQKQSKEGEDTFGQNDDDWAVYTKIGNSSSSGGSNSSGLDGKDAARMAELERLLQLHDPRRLEAASQYQKKPIYLISLPLIFAAWLVCGHWRGCVALCAVLIFAGAIGCNHASALVRRQSNRACPCYADHLTHVPY